MYIQQIKRSIKEEEEMLKVRPESEKRFMREYIGTYEENK